MPRHIDLHGTRWPLDDPAQVELECIKRGGYWDVRGQRLGLGLAAHIVNFSRLVWPWFKWHRWALMHLEELCRPSHRLAVFGPSSCVHGDTILEDPVRGISATVKQWRDAGVRPFVQTRIGPVLATVPFLKGQADLYEVTLSNGRKFKATAGHRLMLPSGAYAEVSSLRSGDIVLGYDGGLPHSISDSARSIRDADVRHWPRTTPDSQSDYPAYPCSDGGLLLLDQGFGQDAVPLRDDVRGRTENASVGVDDWCSERGYSHPYRPTDRPSSFRAFPLDSIWKIHEPLRFFVETPAFAYAQTRSGVLSRLAMSLDWQAQESHHDSKQTCCSSSESLCCLPYAGSMVHPVQVSNIRWAEHADYYDLQVPGPNHYFAEGAIHHNSGKSSTTGLVYLVFYFAHPENTTVLISSTTRDDLELRIWGEIKTFFSEAKQAFPWLPGNLIDSKQLITTDDKGSEFGRDLRNGVICRPAKIGNKWVIGSNMSPYQGIKNDHVYVAADEFGIMPVGIMDALSNLTSNPRCGASFLGNLGDLDTPLGSASEPERGWDALPDSSKSRVYNTRWTNGRCLQFVGMDSPNLDYPEGAEPYPKLIGRRYIAQCAHDYGLDTPFFNMFAAGKIPRGTMENRVLTKADCERNDAFEPVTWGHEPLTRLYCLDLSYTVSHGDRTVGRPLEFGKDTHGQNILSPLASPLVYTPSDRGDTSVEDQLALQCIIECKKWEIPPSHVFYDGTGRASFTASLMRLWVDDSGHSIGTAVNPIEFGGTATKRPNFVNRRYEEDLSARQKKGDLLPCDEVFDKMVTELWFAFRQLVISRQCRNLDMETVKEASKRLYMDSKGHRISVEKKDEIKKRLGRSPDLADNFVAGLEGARRLGFPLGSLDASGKRRNTRWIERASRDYAEARSAVELAA